MFIRNETFRSFLRHYPIVSWIIGINLFIFLIVFFHIMGGYLYNLMVDWNLGVAYGQYWRLVTSIFLHDRNGFAHVLFNSFSIVLFAPALERILGKWKFIVVYLGTGIIGNIATYFLEPVNYASLGASGAIFGLFGVYVYMVMFRKDLIDRASSQIVVIMVIYALVMTFFSSGINILAHLFGLIGGLLLAPPLLSRVPLNFSWQSYATRGHYQETEVTFDPNRWRKKRKFRNQGDFGKKVIWALVILFALFGLIGMIMR